MMSEQQQRRGLDDGSMVQDTKQMVNIVIWAAQVLAVIPRIWWSRSGTIGDRYMGYQGPLAIIVFPILVILIMGSTQPEPYEIHLLGLFWFITLCRLAGHKNVRNNLEKKGIIQHSLYGGTSIFTPWAGTDEIRTKQITEPTAGTLIGGITCLISPALGIGFIICSVAQAIAMEFERMKTVAVKRQMRDALYEQRLMSEYMDEIQRHG